MKYKHYTPLFFLLCCLPLVLLSACSSPPLPPAAEDTLRPGDPFPELILYDQFDTPARIGAGASRLLIAFDMETAKDSNEWLATQDSGFLASRKLQYVNDISKMPRIITRLFAKPKMRRYPFPILLSAEEGALQSVPRTEGKLTLLELAEDGSVLRIRKLDSLAHLTEPVAQ